MLDAVVAIGNEEHTANRLHEVLSYGAAEIIVHPVVVGNPDASYQRAAELVAAVNQTLQ